MLGGLGEGQTGTNLTAAIVGAEVDDNSDGDVLGPPALYSSVERTRGTRRCFWDQRQGEGSAVAVAVANGSEGGARLRERERDREGERRCGGSIRLQGSCGISRASRKQREVGGGRACAGARRPRARRPPGGR